MYTSDWGGHGISLPRRTEEAFPRYVSAQTSGS